MTTAKAPLSLTTANEWLPDEHHCPSWCDGGHAQHFYECQDWASGQMHITSVGGGVTCELTYAGRHVREFGGSWDLTLQQQPLGPGGGFWGPPLVTLNVADRASSRPHSAEVRLTSGELRSLAAQLIAAADLVDLG